MKISQVQLQQIIVEEYLKEEGILQELTDEQKDEMIAWIKGKGPRPKWATDDAGTSRKGKGVQSPMDPSVDRAADTMPFGPSDIPSDDAPERDVSGFQDRAGPPLEDQLMDLIQGLPPEEVADLFQAVFEKIPGVELGAREEEPETLYSPGAEGRPQVGFREELVNKAYARILEMAGLSYGTHSMAGVPGNRDDGDNYESMSDAELIDMAERDGIEEILILDGEGDLVNREEVIAALQDV